MDWFFFLWILKITLLFRNVFFVNHIFVTMIFDHVFVVFNQLRFIVVVVIESCKKLEHTDIMTQGHKVSFLGL